MWQYHLSKTYTQTKRQQINLSKRHIGNQGNPQRLLKAVLNTIGFTTVMADDEALANSESPREATTL